jgi:phosphoribosyl-AMP cyclohydrolase
MAEIYRDPALAASQEEMLALFHASRTAEELLGKIAASGIQEELKTWLLSCDPDMLQTACGLVRQWGSFDPAHGVGASPAPGKSAG